MVKKNEQFDNQKKLAMDYLKKYTNLSGKLLIELIILCNIICLVVILLNKV